MDDHPFSKMTRGHEQQERMTARANVAFEEGKVAYALGVFKLNVRKVGNQLRARERDERGQPDLTFRAFNDTYPTFPLVLGGVEAGGVSLHLDKRAMLPALFREFGQAPFVTAYEEFYEKHAGRAHGRKVGLVFPRKGLKNGLVVYAADDIGEISLCERESMFVYAGGSRKERHWIVVRSFQKVLEAVHNKGHGWRPDGS